MLNISWRQSCNGLQLASNINLLEFKMDVFILSSQLVRRHKGQLNMYIVQHDLPKNSSAAGET